MFLLPLAGALRRSELAAIRVQDLHFTREGLRLFPYIAEHNRRAKPFVWTKPAADILAAASRSPEPSV
ncbi:hypothetical protein ASF60_15530 [Methylobacterium sp. Leaf113]|uniref:hypothetical protein n=1 Tax=Methylobacterium sp. Leaf113 TaxID=1736259 RepID=UPI0006FACF47|nr:hypothetical protein [Methylobacterium sp. Leaf113]KQP93336.1 hypothetical protein ASF60_15530 [Methylobacterium sp. Leaf113]